MTALIGLLLTATLSRAPLHATAGSAAPVVTASAPAAGATATADDVVSHVQQFYAGINQVTAEFVQSVHNAEFGTDKTSKGTVWLMKPGLMRWDYLEAKGGVTKVKSSFIANGATLYVIEHQNKQIIKKNLQASVMPAAVSFLYGKGDLRAEFDAALDPKSGYGGAGDVVLKLTPKQPSAQYKNLYLVVDPQQFRVKESIVVDSSNNVNHFQFNSPDFKTAIEQTRFQFDERSLPSYQLIDGDKPIK